MRGGDVFFDTNILLYLISEDITKADRAETLLALGGVISIQVLNEFAAVDFTELRQILATICAVCIVKPVDIETHELCAPTRLGVSPSARLLKRQLSMPVSTMSQ